MDEKPKKRNEMKYRKDSCGKTWRAVEDPGILDEANQTLMSQRADKLLAFYAGLIPDPRPAWRAQRGVK